MKEFLSKSWTVTKICVYLLMYTLIGLPYAMWKIGRMVFEQGCTKENFETLIQEISENFGKL